MLKYKKVAFAMVLSFCFSAISCVSVKPIYYDDDKKVAENFVEKFHQLLNEQNNDEIFKMFTQKIQTAQSREQFDEALKKLLAVIGKVKDSRLIKSDVKPESSVRLVHMFYETEFEKGKQLEEFDCLVNGQDAIFDFYGHPTQMPSTP